MTDRDESKMRKETILGITLSAVWFGLSIHALDIVGILGPASFGVVSLIGVGIFLAGLLKGETQYEEAAEPVETT